jgi:hypothetical protein
MTADETKGETSHPLQTAHLPEVLHRRGALLGGSRVREDDVTPLVLLLGEAPPAGPDNEAHPVRLLSPPHLHSSSVVVRSTKSLFFEFACYGANRQGRHA